jgi:hypothetical protein
MSRGIPLESTGSMKYLEVPMGKSGKSKGCVKIFKVSESELSLF